MADLLADPAITVRFTVTIDGEPLGEFNSCEGLGAEVVLESREEGGNNSHVWQLPVRLKFPNIKLSRPVTHDTEKIARWFASMTNGFSRRTGQIVAMTGDGDVVARWALDGVIPVRWTGPSLNPETVKVATETIEIAHHGFLEVKTE
jgi:phage tail-like protein